MDGRGLERAIKFSYNSLGHLFDANWPFAFAEPVYCHWPMPLLCGARTARVPCIGIGPGLVYLAF
jgi:hypothetical protein